MVRLDKVLKGLRRAILGDATLKKLTGGTVVLSETGGSINVKPPVLVVKFSTPYKPTRYSDILYTTVSFEFYEAKTVESGWAVIEALSTLLDQNRLVFEDNHYAIFDCLCDPTMDYNMQLDAYSSKISFRVKIMRSTT